MVMKMRTGHTTRHDENLVRFSRIEGQIRGIRRMIEEGAYCMDIVTQIQAVEASLSAAMRRILQKHLNCCVSDALQSGSKRQARKKIDEVLTLLERLG